MTTYQYTIELNDSEYIALENLLKNALAAQATAQSQAQQEFVNIQHCKTIHQKLQASLKNALITSTSSFCG